MRCRCTGCILLLGCGRVSAWVAAVRPRPGLAPRNGPVLLQKWKECRDGVDDACEVWLPEVQPWDGFSEDIANEEPYDAERLKRLDAAISRVMTNRADQPVVIQYRPGARWLWGQWRGTVLPSSKWYIAASMLAGILLDVTLNLSVWRLPTWPLFTVPDARHPVISRLIPLNSFWNQQVTLTTFILTFFLGHCSRPARETRGCWRSFSGPRRTIRSRRCTRGEVCAGSCSVA